MKKMNKYMKATITTIIILALFTIAQRDKIIGYFEPKCIEEGCTETVVEGTNYCKWHLISDDNDHSGTYHSGTVTTTTTAYSDNTDDVDSNGYGNYNSYDNDYDDDSDYTQETTSDNKVYKYHKRIQYDPKDDAYDDGYDDIYGDGDYDYDRYDNDEDYAEGVDDAMEEIGW